MKRLLQFKEGIFRAVVLLLLSYLCIMAYQIQRDAADTYYLERGVSSLEAEVNNLSRKIDYLQSSLLLRY